MFFDLHAEKNIVATIINEKYNILFRIMLEDNNIMVNVLDIILLIKNTNMLTSDIPTFWQIAQILEQISFALVVRLVCGMQRNGLDFL